LFCDADAAWLLLRKQLHKLSKRSLRHRGGVPVRVLVDLRANNSKPMNEQMLTTLRDAGIPMRDKYTGGLAR
jgi:hypothetical protein